ncbi:MAG: helix-turn-helix domain-containing protein [Chloroflexota bacterium]
MTTSTIRQRRSDCPISAVLDILGDKWTLLIIRDVMIDDRHKYNEFAAMKEGIPTNILADRLKRLVDYDILEKRPYQDRPVRYEYYLTDKGKELEPVVMAMATWGLNNVPGTGKSRGY